MLGRALLVLALAWPTLAFAADVVDATGRVVQIPDQITRVLPAGPPAAVLVEAVAPDLMVGWTSPITKEARGLLATETAVLPQVPRLTGREDVTDKVRALKPDLIIDYGTVSPRYVDLARVTQQQTNVPTILMDGSLSEVPNVVRTLGRALNREGRAEPLARFFEAMLALPTPAGAHRRVVYARGPDGLTVAAPDTDVTEVFTRLGYQVVAPAGQGTFRPATIEAIGALDPDIMIFSDSAMRQTLEQNEAWRGLRAVREGHAFVAPSLPFGWMEEPPSINRLLGLTWLSGRDPATLASLFNATVYGHVLTSEELAIVLAGIRPTSP